MGVKIFAVDKTTRMRGQIEVQDLSWFDTPSSQSSYYVIMAVEEWFNPYEFYLQIDTYTCLIPTGEARDQAT